VLNSTVGRVRLVGSIEAVSFLVLLFVAMPLKYLFDKPVATFYVGLVHGLLFLAYATVTYIAWRGGHITARLFGLAALASVLPFGPFVIDRRLKAVEKVNEAFPSAETTAPIGKVP
jgi:integral membrane protein